MRKLLLTTIFLILSLQLASAQVSVNDSLRVLSDTADDVATRIDALRQLGSRMRFTDYDSSLTLYRKALNLSFETKDSLNVMMVAHDFATAKLRAGERDSARFYLDIGLSHKGTIEDRIYILMLQAYGDTYARVPDAEKAMDYYHRSELASIEMEDSIYLPGIYSQMATLLNSNTTDKTLVVEYYKKSVELAPKFADPLYQYIFLYTAANALMRLYPETIGLEFLDKLLVMHRERYPDLGNDANHFELSMVLNFNEDDYEGNIQKMKAYVANAEKTEHRTAALSGLLYLAAYFDNNDSTIVYLNELLKKSTEYDRPGFRANALYALAGAYELKGEYNTALDFWKRERALSDSLINAETLRNISEIRERYEAEKSEQRIEFLEQENFLERTISEKTALQRNWLLAGILLIVILAGFILSFFRQRLKTTSLEASVAQAKITELEQQQHILTMNSMIEGQENERRRIAQDLHDGLGGLLTTIKMHFSNIQQELTALSDLNMMEKTGSLIEHANTEVRKLAHEMMPGSLVKLGLVEGLSELCDRTRIEGKLDVHYEALNVEQRLNETSEIMLFRVCQELLNNIIKHSEADDVIVQLSDTGDHIELTVEDNGIGFDADTADQRNTLGLKSIRSRARFLNGNVDIFSKEGTGTTITVTIPKQGNAL